ncbi:hypothetical protein F2Q70_00011094 [Brassica cretica]|uniref:Uncharacterized protein n=1 Tax=Brassica cretica TaxID=69181 RepID=A0A8S9M4Y2_BRACR|nr:hypothetical protein F2Q70_00011094 [Brassica cretica]
MCQDVDSSNENLLAFTMFEETDLSYEFKMPPTASSCYYHMLCLGEVPQGHLSDVNEVPNHHDVLEAAHSLLTGHQDNPEFALAMCPTEPFVLSGGGQASWCGVSRTTSQRLVQIPNHLDPSSNRLVKVCLVTDSCLILWDARTGTSPVTKIPYLLHPIKI